MAVDQAVCAAARLFDQERPIGDLEEEVLGAMEDHDDTYKAWAATRKDLSGLYARILEAWVYDGALLDLSARKVARCIANVRVVGGSARGACSFRIVGSPTVTVAQDGDPAISNWSCSAVPISPKTGKDMSGRPSNSVRSDNTVTLQGSMWQLGFSDLRGAAAAQAERDDFIEMVATAEATLIGRRAQRPGDQESTPGDRP